MTRDELIAKISKKTGLTKTQVSQSMKTMIEEITDALRKKDSVSFVGFGTFKTTTRKARTGRNPRTGEIINIPATRVPKFQPGKVLRDAVRGKSSK